MCTTKIHYLSRPNNILKLSNHKTSMRLNSRILNLIIQIKQYGAIGKGMIHNLKMITKTTYLTQINLA